jgi:galactokinase
MGTSQDTYTRALQGFAETFGSTTPHPGAEALPLSASAPHQGATPQLLFSPYRVCPLGAHVDHQDGLVSGMAIDKGVVFAFAPRDDSCVRAASANFSGTIEFDLRDVPPPAKGDWGNFPRGAATALQRHVVAHRGDTLTRGVDLFLVGELPVGGLSSSAAVGVGYLLALEASNGLAVTPEENVQLARAIENDYVGLHSGVLDQSMILQGRQDRLLVLDCRSGERRYVALGEGAPEVVIGVAYSGLSQGLVGTGYNQRVSECREAASQLLELAGLPHPEGGARLRDVPAAAFDAHGDALPESLARRARHYFTEQARVQDGARAWGAGDVARVGALVTQSGRSSIENYECGAPELVALYEALIESPGVYGARFSGAGFRGSCIALVDPVAFESVGEGIQARYLRAFPQYAETFGFFRCASGPAAHLVPAST